MKHLPLSKGQSFQQPATSATPAGYPVQNHGLQAATLNLPGRELRRTRKRRRISLVTLAAYLVVLIALVCYLYPLLYLVNISLKTLIGYISDPVGLTKTLNWQSYVDAWVQGDFSTYLVNTLFYALAATVISVLSAVFLAFPVARGYVKGSRFWYMLFVISLFLPSGLIPQFQLILHIGLYNTQIGYILLSAGTGLGPFLIIGYLRSLPKELDEAAAIDGCGYFRYIWTVVIPLARPVIVTAAILQMIGIWNDIIGPTIYLSDPSYYPVSLGLFNFYGNYGNQWSTLAAATLIVAAPLVIIYIVLQRYIIDGAIAGAVRG
jgi:raffinose/stachyose/melibiose transport system permease protein